MFEGVEGAGKSTQIPLLASYLSSNGIPVICTLEPGGTAVGQRIREILLDPSLSNMDAVAELMLYAAARAQHVQEVILPSLHEGKTVICDRFSDSTIAYQGYGRGLDLGLIKTLDDMATAGLSADLTIILDLPVQAGLERNAGAGKRDRLEMEPHSFHEKVREGFHKIAGQSPKTVLLGAEGSPEEVHLQVRNLVSEMLCL